MMNEEALIAELEELRRRENNDEDMTIEDYERWAEIADALRDGYEKEAKRHDA